MISVVVPVYNVQEYLDDCMQSIIDQTYRDIEIILINDGSKDNSAEICRKWALKDQRIRFIDKENEGQAKTRNVAIPLARGEWITFVDSDDWLDTTMLEKLYAAAENAGADISMCEAYTQNSEGKFSGYSLQRLDKPVIHIQKEKEFLLTVRYTLWSKLYKTSLFTDNKIEQPAIKFEDFACVPVLYALAQKVACVEENLYYYRYRPSSTVRDVRFIEDRIHALEYMMQGFLERGLGDEWGTVLKRICTERGLILMRQVYPLLNKSFQFFCEEYDALLKKYFHSGLSDISPRFQTQCKNGSINASVLGEYNLAVVGSYNLMIAAKIIMNLGMPDFMEQHVCFSSVISMMSDADESFYNMDLTHKNSFRQKHLVQDFTKSFAHKNVCEYKDIDFFLVDFLEERYDIGERNGCYFTLSDAFQDISSEIQLDYRVISRYSEEAEKLWEESCLKFIALLQKYISPERVILVRSVLCEKYGLSSEIQEYFPDVEEIRRTNWLLNRYYDFFVRNMPGIRVVNVDDLDWFTDKNYRHGCYPWHLNQTLYWYLQMRISAQIKDFGGTQIDRRLKEHYDWSQLPEQKDKWKGLFKGKEVLIWFEKEGTENICLTETIQNVMRYTYRNPYLIIIDGERTKKEYCGIKVGTSDVLQDEPKRFYVIVARCEKEENIAEKLENFGYRRDKDYCMESELAGKRISFLQLK